MKKKNKVRLVDNTYGASYLDCYLYFNASDVLWIRSHFNQRALTSTRYPDTVDFCINGSSEVFRARTEDFDKEILT